MPVHIKPLTALRFFAALWVVAFHYWPDLSPVRPAFVAKGYLGVELFFVLSGFILSHVYLQAHAQGRFGYGAFLWTRLARIYPVHLATLAGVGVMGLTALALGVQMKHAVLVWSALPANLLLVHAWGTVAVAGWNNPSWSISAEWFAYLLFPAFAWATWRLRARPWMALTGTLAASAVLYAAFERLAGFSLTEATMAWGALRIVPCFSLGCAAYLVWRSGVTTRRREAVVGSCGFTALIALAAVLGAPDVLLVALFVGLILSLAALTSTGSRALSSPVLVYLGEVSFSLYMVCIPWQLVFDHGLAPLLHLQGDTLALPLWLALFAGVVPAAMVVHHLVERPARTWMRRHDPFPDPRAIPAHAVAAE